MFDLNDFLNVVIPSILYRVRSGYYYIAGGRAYDFYFKEKSNSIDWDIDAEESVAKYIINL